MNLKIFKHSLKLLVMTERTFSINAFAGDTGENG